MRDQALLWTGDYYDLIRHYQYTLGIEDATEEPTISRKSYRDYKQLFRDRRAGVILYLNKHILANGFEIDPFLKEDDTLFAVSIPINPNFDYSSAVVCVEPVCPYDHYILSRSLTPDMAVTRSRFGSYREMCKYVRTKQFL
ncbi:hypothetical protein HYY71_05735 [Candidatus Woesearchaeota archaeon]|nr:hypothetical protein [Candidatus Woesearchaeota archaeon]